MSEFDTTELVPKVDSQVLEFFSKYPDYNGKDVVVAILDTGNDALSNGLMVCPDGTPKYLDFIDATGSGDVDTSVVVEAVEENGSQYIYGLSSRKYKLCPKFVNPSGQYHVGIKRAYDLFPKPLVERLQKLNAERTQLLNGDLESTLREALSVAKEAQDIADLEAKLDYLKKSTIGTVGPVLDCICWNDGTNNVAVIAHDDEFVVDLAGRKPYAAYKVKQDVIKFDEESNLAITLNFYQGLDVLSIVVPAGSHGTHVAGIVAAYHEDDPRRNGQAPGAKLVSIKIGDTHLGSMETSTGLNRALLACEEWKVDVANMSYGEYSIQPDHGRFPDMMKTLIQKGMVFVTSAGNSGPCLSTMGAPGCDGDGITVGAYLTPEIVDSLYSFITKPERSNYYWSSRGPSMNGTPVTVSGLGVAITAVPSYTLTPTKLMNGTSMASPNVCGIVALLICGMKARNIKYTPEAIKLALQNTAIPGKCVHASGSGYVQLIEAFHLLQLHNTSLVGCDIAVSGSNTANVSQKGIFLSQQLQSSRKHLFNVTVTPKLGIENTITPTRSFVHEYTKEEVTAMEVLCMVETDAKWIKTPDTIVLTSEGKSLQVYVDPTGLPPNSVQHANVSLRVADTNIITAVIPVTVVIPNKTNNAVVTKLQPGIPQTCVFDVPRTAQHVTLRLRTSDAKFKNQTLVVSTNQLLQQVSHNNYATGNMVNVTYDEDTVVNIPAQAGSVMQVCITRPWNQPETCDVKVEFDAQGVSTNGATHTTLSFTGIDKYEVLRFETATKRCILAPTAEFKKVTKSVQPTKAFLEKLSDRDTLLTGVSNYRLTLEYTFKLEKAGKVTPKLSTMYGLLYEQYVDAQRVHIFNSNNKLVHVSDAFPRGGKLTPDTYVVRAEIKHNNVAILEALKTTVLSYQLDLEKPAAAKVVSIIGEPTVLTSPLHEGEVVRGFLELPTADIAGASDGDVLTGSLTAIKDSKNCSTPISFVYRCGKAVTVTKTAPGNFKEVFDTKKKTETPAAKDVDINEAKIEMMKNYSKTVSADKAFAVYVGLMEETFNAKVAESGVMDKATVQFASSVLSMLLKSMQQPLAEDAYTKIQATIDTVLGKVVDEAQLAFFLLKEFNADDKTQTDKKEALEVLKQAYLVRAITTIRQGVNASVEVTACQVMFKANAALSAALEALLLVQKRKFGSVLALLDKIQAKDEQEIILQAIKNELLTVTALPPTASHLNIKVQVETLLSKIIFGENFEKRTLNQLVVDNQLAIEPFM